MKSITPHIVLEQVRKVHADKIIIDNVNLVIRAGSRVTLLGANGSGKSTLIKIMLGLEAPTTGKVLLNGLPPANPASRLTVGAVLQDSHFIEELTVRETIQLVRLHYHSPFSLEKIIYDFSLQSFLNQRTGTLSQGQKKRLAIALAFSGNPKLVFLDEPTAGLDVQSRMILWKYIKSFRKSDTTIFLTTHYIEEAKALSNQVIFLNQGKLTTDTLENVFDKITEG